MKKIVIAPDKFKGSLTGIEFCNSVEKGIRKHIENIDIVKLPLADGGDGTVAAMQYYTAGEFVSVMVNDPLLRKTNATYLYSSDQKMAFIEMAEASGINLLKTDELNPLQTSTFGTGELVKDAILKGAKHIILGIGGSSTNDAGMGMAKALGFRFIDKSGNELEGKGTDLNRLHRIDILEMLPELKNVEFEVACDVDNPLFGKNGAAYIYSPQKGATPEMVKELDLGLQNFHKVVKAQFGIELQKIKGAGAAGGLGAGCVFFLNAQLISGIALIKDVANFIEQTKDADWIITGEGKFDEQTFSGKVIKGVLESRTHQKLAVFCGVNKLSKAMIGQHGIDYISEIMTQAKDFNDSMKNAKVYLENAAVEFAKSYLFEDISE